MTTTRQHDSGHNHRPGCSCPYCRSAAKQQVESDISLPQPAGGGAAAGRFAPSILDPGRVDLVDVFDTGADDADDGFGNGGNRLAGFPPDDEFADEARQRGQNACTCCGAKLRYVAVFHHADYGLFQVGTDCAENLGVAAQLGTKISDLRASAAEHRENRKRQAQRADMLAADPELASALDYADRSGFIADINAKLDFRITDRQRDAVVQAAARIRESDARQAEQDAIEDAMPKQPVPEGRMPVTGTVLSDRYDPNPFGPGDVHKMLVRDDRGFKLWMTVPAALDDQTGYLRGSEVSFTATLTQSDRDAYFGFGKRPAKAAVTRENRPDPTPEPDTDDDGVCRWLLPDGTKHRTDGPAITSPDGFEAWYQHGNLHRDDGPAMTKPDGTRLWYHHGTRVDPPTNPDPDNTAHAG